MMKAKVHEADLPDREGARLLLSRGLLETLPHLRHLWADAGYRGAGDLREWITERLGLSLEIVERRRCRWVVERTFAWMCGNRRMSRDYEFLPETGEALIST
jgi:putative transposase